MLLSMFFQTIVLIFFFLFSDNDDNAKNIICLTSLTQGGKKVSPRVDYLRETSSPPNSATDARMQLITAWQSRGLVYLILQPLRALGW